MRTTNLSRPSRFLLRGAVALATAIGVSLLIPGCGVGYVVRSAYFQAELLGARQPIEEIRASGALDEIQQQKLALVADVKVYGKEIGLDATDNYETIAWEWERKIWNLSACKPLSLKPRVWTFPIVGRVPYLGFFRTEDAERWRSRLENKGYETYLRTAGAYSTLGWFRDPILKPMLKWDDHRLANTVLHELAHATLWIKGSVKFNESFANFFGEKAAIQYLTSRYGAESEAVARVLRKDEDLDRWRKILRALYQDLATVYETEDFSDAEKLEHKEALFASLSARVDAAGMNHPERFQRVVARGPWNNARMMQYRTYNYNRDRFQRLLDTEHGDLLAFIQHVASITKGSRDPFKSLEAAADPQRQRTD